MKHAPDPQPHNGSADGCWPVARARRRRHGPGIHPVAPAGRPGSFARGAQSRRLRCDFAVPVGAGAESSDPQPPDLFREIADTVETQALELTARRGELDSEVARIWARRFTESELETVAEFFDSELGAKYKQMLPQIGEELIAAGRRWTSRIGDELYELSLEDMERQGHEF